jgi:hypothetical protein
MEKILIFVFLVFAAVFVSSCSSEKVEVKTESEVDDEIDSIGNVSAEINSEEGPIFTYKTGENMTSGPPEIYLTITGEPVPSRNLSNHHR